MRMGGEVVIGVDCWVVPALESRIIGTKLVDSDVRLLVLVLVVCGKEIP